MELSIVVAIILILSSIISPKSKSIAVLFFLFMWSLWGWNTWNGDYEAYKDSYEQSYHLLESFDYEVGYSILEYFSFFIGLSYAGYLKVVSLFVLAIAFWFGNTHTKYIALYSLGYFFIFMLEFVFIRNYIAHTILLISFYYISYKPNYYKYILTVLLAGSFHVTTFLFIFFIFASPLMKISLKKILLYVCSFIFILLTGLNSLASFFGEAIYSRFVIYSVEQSSLKIIIFHLLVVLMICIYFYLNNKNKKFKFNECAVKVNLISLFYLGLYYYIPYSSRFLRYLFVINLTFLLFNIVDLRLKSRSLRFSIALSFILFLSYYTFYTSKLEYTIEPLFYCNEIWGDNLNLHKL